jgi:type II secretory pathway component PulF
MTNKEQMLLAKRLSFLVRAGVPLIDGLKIIRAQALRKSAAALDVAISRVSRGEPLADALEGGRLFGDFSLNLIRIGQESGTLGSNLAYLADELHKSQQLRRKIQGALLYPLFILVATIGMVVMLLSYLFPKLMPIFSSMHTDLPITTRALIAASEFIRSWGLLTFIALVLFCIAFYFIRKKFARARLWSDAAVIRIPLLGSLVRAYLLSSACRTLSLLLHSGVALAPALELSAQTSTNRAYRITLHALSRRVMHGEKMSDGLDALPKLFPPTLTHLVAIAETTGTLPETFGYLAEQYEEDVDEQTKLLSSAAEPALMIVMGLFVGLIAISVITPIYSLTQHLNAK